MLGLALSLAIPLLPGGPGDSTPGGAGNVLLLADGVSGLLLADGSSFLLLSS